MQGTGQANLRPRILIVDDHPQIVRILWDALGRAGFDLRAVPTTGTRAVVQARTFRPGLVCMGLTKLDGAFAQRLNHLREAGNLERTPFVLLRRDSAPDAGQTAQAVRAEDRERFVDSRTRVLTSPFSPRYLLEEIRSLLAIRPAAESIESHSRFG